MNEEQMKSKAAHRRDLSHALSANIRLLSDSDANVRRNALIIVNDSAQKEIGEQSSIPPLNELLMDQDANVRRMALSAISRLAIMEIGDSSSIPPLN